MVFNSALFFLFFAVVLGIHSLPLPWKVKKLNLVVASSLFYAAWHPLFVLLLWVSMVTDYLVAARIAVATTRRAQRTLLGVSLFVNIGMLAVFKYGGFVLANLDAGLTMLGVPVQPRHFDILLPVGISFYTFETISYSIDVYRGRERPWTSFLDFAVFLTFFPHLVAGPIVRPSDFLPQCQHPRRATADQLAWGLVLLVVGLFEKVVVADGVLAPIADRVFSAEGALRARDAWGGTLAFSGQIFCDFAGYSLCAIGVALCFGFQLPDNFMSPYVARGFSDFWRRWHVSLSSWLRDYVYIPLGGNRRGSLRTYLNLMATMLIGGLWHGASWTYVFWGGLHGAYLTGERALSGVFDNRRWLRGTAGNLIGQLITFLFVCLAWVFFRAPRFGTAFHLLGGLFGIQQAASPATLGKADALWLLLTLPAMLALQAFVGERPLAEAYRRTPRLLRGLALAVMLVAILTENGADRAFIYFQF